MIKTNLLLNIHVFRCRLLRYKLRGAPSLVFFTNELKTEFVGQEDQRRGMRS
jgi:hypothetical protein